MRTYTETSEGATLRAKPHAVRAREPAVPVTLNIDIYLDRGVSVMPVIRDSLVRNNFCATKRSNVSLRRIGVNPIFFLYKYRFIDLFFFQISTIQTLLFHHFTIDYSGDAIDEISSDDSIQHFIELFNTIAVPGGLREIRRSIISYYFFSFLFTSWYPGFLM
jgi:hypothetical protein